MAVSRRRFLQGAAGLLVPAALGVEPIEAVRRFWVLDRTMAADYEAHLLAERVRLKRLLEDALWRPEGATLRVFDVAHVDTGEIVFFDGQRFVRGWGGTEPRPLGDSPVVTILGPAFAD